MSLLIIGWLKPVKNKATVLKHSGAENGSFPQLLGTENLTLQKRMFSLQRWPREETNPGQQLSVWGSCTSPACRRWMQMETAVPISSSCRSVVRDVFTHRGLCSSLNSAFLRFRGGRVHGYRLLVCTARHCGRSWVWAPVLSVSTCFSPFMCSKAVKMGTPGVSLPKHRFCTAVLVVDEATAHYWSFFKPHP